MEQLLNPRAERYRTIRFLFVKYLLIVLICSSLVDLVSITMIFNATGRSGSDDTPLSDDEIRINFLVAASSLLIALIVTFFATVYEHLSLCVTSSCFLALWTMLAFLDGSLILDYVTLLINAAIALVGLVYWGHLREDKLIALRWSI